MWASLSWYSTQAQQRRGKSSAQGKEASKETEQTTQSWNKRQKSHQTKYVCDLAKSVAHAMLEALPTEALLGVADCPGWPHALTMYRLRTGQRPREVLFLKLKLAVRRRWAPTQPPSRSPSFALQHFWLTSRLADLRLLNDVPRHAPAEVNGVRFAVRSVFGTWSPLPAQPAGSTAPMWGRLPADAQWL